MIRSAGVFCVLDKSVKIRVQTYILLEFAYDISFYHACIMKFRIIRAVIV